MTTNKLLSWVNVKDGTPPQGEDVEIRTNSMDRNYRLGRYDYGFKCFYDDDNNVVTGQEWRMITGKTPVLEKTALLMKNIDDVPEHFVKDEMDSNEYYITFVGRENELPRVYHYSETESNSVWS